MPDKFYTEQIIGKVVKHALEAAEESAKGRSSVTLGRSESAQSFSLNQGGYCARFVRQVYETACGFKPHSWSYASTDARSMTAALAADGHRVTDGSLLPGDIVGIHKNSGEFGHIAVFVGRIDGRDMIAENTSSRFRGKPRRAGTKLTRYEDIAHRVTGVYRLLHDAPPARWPQFRSFMYVGNRCREIVLMPNGDHRLDQRKVYWQFKQ